MTNLVTSFWTRVVEPRQLKSKLRQAQEGEAVPLTEHVPADAELDDFPDFICFDRHAPETRYYRSQIHFPESPAETRGVKDLPNLSHSSPAIVAWKHLLDRVSIRIEDLCCLGNEEASFLRAGLSELFSPLSTSDLQLLKQQTMPRLLLENSLVDVDQGVFNENGALRYLPVLSIYGNIDGSDQEPELLVGTEDKLLQYILTRLFTIEEQGTDGNITKVVKDQVSFEELRANLEALRREKGYTALAQLRERRDAYRKHTQQVLTLGNNFNQSPIAPLSDEKLAQLIQAYSRIEALLKKSHPDEMSFAKAAIEIYPFRAQDSGLAGQLKPEEIETLQGKIPNITELADYNLLELRHFLSSLGKERLGTSLAGIPDSASVGLILMNLDDNSSSSQRLVKQYLLSLLASSFTESQVATLAWQNRFDSFCTATPSYKLADSDFSLTATQKVLLEDRVNKIAVEMFPQKTNPSKFSIPEETKGVDLIPAVIEYLRSFQSSESY